METTKVNYTKQSKTFIQDETLFNDVFVYGRKVGGVYITQRQPLTYRQLQRACKDAGISAKGSANALRKSLWMSEHGDKTPNPVPLTPRQKRAQLANDSQSHSTAIVLQSHDDSDSFDFKSAYACDTSVTYEVPCQTVVPETPTHLSRHLGPRPRLKLLRPNHNHA
jgi:hypothetical protein